MFLTGFLAFFRSCAGSNQSQETAQARAKTCAAKEAREEEEEEDKKRRRGDTRNQEMQQQQLKTKESLIMNLKFGTI